jgi:hypothetical protein
MHFTEVTDRSGLVARGYGMGVATADFNNDGCMDVYLTKFGDNQLFRNNCDGTFTDVTRPSGTADSGWSVSATFFDFDRDGWLDLFVGHYLALQHGKHDALFQPGRHSRLLLTVRPVTAADRLFHNNRDGTFRDVTADAGLTLNLGRARCCFSRLQSRRMARSLCHERRPAESAVDESASTGGS